MSKEPKAASRRVADVLQNLVGLGIVIWFGWYLWARRDHLESILSVSAVDVTLLCFLTIASWTFTAAQSAVLYRASGINIGFRENWLLTIASAFGSYLPMMAGTVVRFHYMKSIHGLRYARSGSIAWLRALMTALSTAAFGLIGTVGLRLTAQKSSAFLLLLFGGMLLAPLLALLVNPPESWIARLPRAKNARDFFDGLSLLRKHRRAGVWAFIWIALQQVSLAVRLAIAASATGQAPSFLLLCILGPLGIFVSFVSITPAALGLREAVLGYATYATGTSFGSGLYMGALDRAVSLALLSLFGSVSLLYLWRKIRRAERARARAALSSPSVEQGSSPALPPT